MLHENLNEANRLDREIKQCKDRIKTWKNKTKFLNGMTQASVGDNDWEYVYIDPMPFNVVKSVCIDALNKQLQELETQLLNLK